jgi:hypothetical protein
VVAQTHAPSIQITTVNMLRPKQPSWTPPLANTIRPRPFTKYAIDKNLHLAGLILLTSFPNSKPMKAAWTLTVHSNTQI